MDVDAIWDRKLHIRTTGKENGTDFVRYPYEATDYRILEELAQKEYIGHQNTVVDYGCGKGRVVYYLSYKTHCRSIGIEYNPNLFRCALANQKSALSSSLVSIRCVDAMDFEIPPQADRFYFFNPFSPEIFKQVLANIIGSWTTQRRRMLFFLYYPAPSYIEYLSGFRRFTQIDVIRPRSLLSLRDDRENITVFQWP